MSTGELFTREEALAGLPARRAHFLLYLIEIQTARLVARQWDLPTLDLTPAIGVWRPALLADEQPSDGTSRDDDRGLLTPFGQGRDRLPPPSIWEIERYASEWASLVPENPSLRAAVGRLLGEKYRFTQRAIPGIRAALGLDDPAVQAAFERVHGRPLASIYAPHLPMAERLRRTPAALGKRLSALPPFWFAFVFILALGVPQALLALPIAVAAVGALRGIGLIFLGGCLSLVTVIGIAEAAARNGAVRYGSAYFGRLVADFLGPAGAAGLTTFALGLFALSIPASLIGIGTTLAHFTPVPAAVWAALTFAGGLYLLARGSRTVSLGPSVILAAMVVVMITLVLLTCLSHFQWAHLRQSAAAVPGGHRPGLEAVVGVVLMGYFIEAFVVQCAKAILPRDPSGRSLIWGSVAGLTAVGVLLCVWVFVVNGAVPPEALVGERGSVFVPLSAVAGPSVALLGSLLVVLLPGLAVLRGMMGAYGMIREWLPAPPRLVTFLPREQSRLVLRSRRGGRAQRGQRRRADGARDDGCLAPAIGFTLTECEGDRGSAATGGRFRISIQAGDDVRQMERTIAGRWDVSSLFAELPELRHSGLRFSLQVVEVNEEGVRLLVETPPGVTCETEPDPRGLRLADLACLPDDEWQVLNWLLRRGEAGLEEVAAAVGQSVEAARATLGGLAKKGLLRESGSDQRPCYRARFAPRRPSRLPNRLWQALTDSGPTPPADGEAPARPVLGDGPGSPDSSSFAHRLWPRLLTERGRFVLAVAPLVLIFFATEWLLLTGKGSFTGALGYLGLITNAYATGIVPLLLLRSCRRKGEVQPGIVLRFAGHPLLLGSLYLLYLALLLVHGLILWQEPWARAASLLTAGVILGTTVAMARQGAFSPRAIVELREELRGGKGVFSIMAAGEPLKAAAELEYPKDRRESHAAGGEVPEFSALRSATFHLPESPARELKVWAHRVTPDGDSRPLPAVVEVRCGDVTRRVDLSLSRGQVVLPISRGACEVRIRLADQG
jgi:hypothetical protein